MRNLIVFTALAVAAALQAGCGSNFEWFPSNTTFTNSSTATQINVAPVARIVFTPLSSIYTKITKVTLDGSSSSDANGDALTYKWSAPTIPAGSAAGLSDPAAAKPTFTPDLPGDYVLTLVVNDGNLDSSASVTITAKNIPPVADAGRDQTVTVGETVKLDGSGSKDANGDILSYLWARKSSACGDISDPTIKQPTLTTPFIGTCVIELQVQDQNVVSTIDTVTITVKPPTGSLTFSW